MARAEDQREDLLRDAAAFGERIAWRTIDGREVFMGFRKSGGLSIYLDQDPVYHFTSDVQLRRAFVDDRLLKAEGRKLVEMRRQRPGGEVQLVSRALDAEATCEFLHAMQTALQTLSDDLEQRRLQLVGQIPVDAAIEERCREWLDVLVEQPLRIAASPHAR
jgi:hypothetical protein